MAHRLARTSSQSRWAVVLAGGQGRRLRSLVQEVCGDSRPKQFAPLMGGRTLLRRTLDRVAREFAPERTVVVTLRSQLPLVLGGLRPGEATRVLAQPEDRGTAPAILYAAHWIHWQDPQAVIGVFPSDHFFAEEQAFMRHVGGVVDFVERNPRRLVLLGAAPTGPEQDHGWIMPGAAVGAAGGLPVADVHRFVEKPAEGEAESCLAAGGLWSTFVFVAKAGAVLALGRQHLPELVARLGPIAPYAGAADSWALRQAYLTSPAADFSRDVLQLGSPGLAVVRLPWLGWSDWGTPARVRASFGRPENAGARPFDCL